jgi:hypothetical protein
LFATTMRGDGRLARPPLLSRQAANLIARPGIFGTAR